jgi:aspartate-semialdehyde dehydrogenase
MMEKLNVAVLGATGAVGQRFVQLLENHPWFQVAEVIGSARSAGHIYGEITNWVLDGNPPESVAHLTVKALEDDFDSPLIFSALPKEPAKIRELALAEAGHVVCTNAGVNRMLEDVPLLLPEVNAEHIHLIEAQRRKRGWTTGALVANSNCTVMPVVMSLAPLLQFGVSKLHLVSEQAISGAGYPGVPSLDILDNVVPYVPSDEQKMETESLKMLGRLDGDQITHLNAVVGATCTRVPVIDGHLVNISVTLDAQPSIDEIIAAWDNSRSLTHLPSAPERPVQYLKQVDRPQIRRDRNAGNGMATSVGRIRECPILGYKYAALTHNTIRGAAGSSIINAELMAVEGYLGEFRPVVETPVTA